jgi:hypothetical protein
MILVTGATGHVGGEMAQQLVAAGKPVRVLVRRQDHPQLARGAWTPCRDEAFLWDITYLCWNLTRVRRGPMWSSQTIATLVSITAANATTGCSGRSAAKQDSEASAVRADPLAKQECEATRGQRTDTLRRRAPVFVVQNNLSFNTRHDRYLPSDPRADYQQPQRSIARSPTARCIEGSPYQLHRRRSPRRSARLRYRSTCRRHTLPRLSQILRRSPVMAYAPQKTINAAIGSVNTYPSTTKTWGLRRRTQSLRCLQIGTSARPTIPG